MKTVSQERYGAQVTVADGSIKLEMLRSLRRSRIASTSSSRALCWDYAAETAAARPEN